jgi:hypothetical protein
VSTTATSTTATPTATTVNAAVDNKHNMLSGVLAGGAVALAMAIA